MNKTIQNALIASDRLFEIMDLEREETTNKIDLQTDKIGDIVFENVFWVKWSFALRGAKTADCDCPSFIPSTGNINT